MVCVRLSMIYTAKRAAEQALVGKARLDEALESPTRESPQCAQSYTQISWKLTQKCHLHVVRIFTSGQRRSFCPDVSVVAWISKSGQRRGFCPGVVCPSWFGFSSRDNVVVSVRTYVRRGLDFR